ncbi:MAG: retron St85 family RNA-directed DNA polymerase [Altererythrobacter sp.]|nr:retron St85 family RNA-directed DNA polymerase [Altererythrobacter sp.]
MSDLIALFVHETGLGEHDIRKIVATAPARYKTYAIKKRNGIDRRIISQPARELKLLQRTLIDAVLKNLPVHRSATAYRTGMSIIDNVRPHINSGAILKLDFSDFFPSLRESDWREYCVRNEIFRSEEDIEVSGLVLFKKERQRRELRLSIGAPSSPIVSNILMFDIDSEIESKIVSEEVVYTRYADDMTFSARRTGFLNKVEKNVREILRGSQSLRLQLNDDKTVYATKKYKRQVTGLIITNDATVSVGRERKRNLMAAIHAALSGKLSGDQVRETLGMVSFVISVEPDFKKRIERKNGEDALALLSKLASTKGT